MRFQRGRRSLREILAANNAADRYYALMAGKEPQMQSVIKPKRAPGKPSGKPLERSVLREIYAALRLHPLVAIVERRQAGSFVDKGYTINVGRRGTPDLTGVLVGGRAFGIEVKAPGRHPTDIQWKRIYEIRNAGGIAGCAHSVAEAFDLIAAPRPDPHL